MRTGRPKAALVLSAEQRDELERWVRRRSTAQALALRARIILSCAESGSNALENARLYTQLRSENSLSFAKTPSDAK